MSPIFLYVLTRWERLVHGDTTCEVTRRGKGYRATIATTRRLKPKTNCFFSGRVDKPWYRSVQRGK